MQADLWRWSVQGDAYSHPYSTSYGGSGFICKPDGGVDVADEVKAGLKKSAELKF